MSRSLLEALTAPTGSAFQDAAAKLHAAAQVLQAEGHYLDAVTDTEFAQTTTHCLELIDLAAYEAKRALEQEALRRKRLVVEGA